MLVVSPYTNFHPYLVDWTVIEPYWRQNIYHPLERHALRRAFHRRWFGKNREGQTVFLAGAIEFDEHRGCVMFVNGRHRTNLLLLYSGIVPVACSKSILRHPVLATSLLAEIDRQTRLSLPKLPVVDYPDPRYGSSCSPSLFAPSLQDFAAGS